ncbi:MAG: hypothetical protein ACW99G_10945 [Candidatus Thorarchaeota archaeon]|jgi:hypothetical protein
MNDEEMSRQELAERINDLLWNLHEYNSKDPIMSFSEEWIKERKITPLELRNLYKIIHAEIKRKHMDLDY